MAAASSKPQQTAGQLICIVDPDETLARRIASLIGTLGPEPRIYADGQAMLAAAGYEPLAVISEMRLPDMSGVELIAALRAKGQRAPVILLADDGDVATAVTAIRGGALDFIEKPNVDRLLAWHVSRLLEHGEVQAPPEA